MELPRLERGVLYIGDSQLVLRSCDLDMLINAFGYPELYLYLLEDDRFLIFKFQQELGNLFAFVFFQQL